jgi:hypothetical protein
MNKLALIILVTLLLAACAPAETPQPSVILPTNTSTEPPTTTPTAPPPASTPTSAPVEALATSPSEIIGIWGLPGINSNLEIKTDGTYRITSKYGDLIDFGNYSFDAGKFTWVNTSMCRDKPATYDVFVATKDGKPLFLRFQVVGSDPCESRKGFGIAPYQNP